MLSTVRTRTTTTPKPAKRRSGRSKRAPRSNVTTTTTSKTSRRSRRSNRSRPMSMSGSRASIDEFNCYVNTLRNPWEHGPCRIGFGTMVPTQLGTGFGRSTLTANADGSLAIAMVPSIQNTIFYNNSGVAGTTWTAISCANVVALGNLMSEGRVVSGGVRAIPQVPSTSSPGLAYAGSLSSQTTAQIQASSPTLLITSPSLKMGFGASGSSAVIYPVDPTSFTFLPSALIAPATTTLWTTSVAILVFTGLPASSTVLIEFALNLEGTTNQNNYTAALQNPTVADDAPSLADYFPSLDNVWSNAKRLLPEAGSVNEAFATANNIGRAAVGAFSTYRNIRNTYFPRARGINPPGRVLIEEVE